MAVDQTFNYCCLDKAGEFKLIEVSSQQSVQEGMVHEANLPALQCKETGKESREYSRPGGL